MAGFLKNLFATKTSFQTALAAYGVENCARSGSTILIGLPAKHGNFAPVETVFDLGSRFSFLAAPAQADVIQAFANSQESQQAEFIALGTTSLFAETNRAGGYDITAAVQALASANLAHLKHLSLGEMEMLANGHPLYCQCGDIGSLIQSAPHLRRLSIFGSFDLAQPLSHPELEHIEIDVDDIAGSAGELDQTTFNNMLTGDMPKLRQLTIDMDDEPDARLTLPSAFTDRLTLPALRQVHIGNLDDIGRTWIEEFQG